MAIENAKREVNDLFKDISPMVLEITDRYSKELDSLINKIADAKTLTNDELSPRRHTTARSIRRPFRRPTVPKSSTV